MQRADYHKLIIA